MEHDTTHDDENTRRKMEVRRGMERGVAGDVTRRGM
jgi:hypothetical protein